MKQVDDNRTIEIALDEQKRGRGRPTIGDAPLTGKERAKRYRDAHKASTLPPAPADPVPPDSRLAALEKELAELKREEATRTMYLVAAHAEASHLAKEVAEWKMKFDLEHQARVAAERRLATLKAKEKNSGR